MKEENEAAGSLAYLGYGRDGNEHEGSVEEGGVGADTSETHLFREGRSIVAHKRDYNKVAERRGVDRVWTVLVGRGRLLHWQRYEYSLGAVQLSAPHLSWNIWSTE